MRKFICFIGALIVCFSILSACQSSNSNKKTSDKTSLVKENDSSNQSSDDGEKDKSEENDNKAATSSGEFKDQTDLKIGDTGKLDSTLGKYEITINSVKMKDKLDDKFPNLDHLFVTEITLKNLGDQPIDPMEIIDLELTDDLKASGSSDVSQHYKVDKAITGKVEPGDSMTGEAVFEGYDSEKYYIRINPGLIAAKAVKNNAIWTFKKSEAK